MKLRSSIWLWINSGVYMKKIWTILFVIIGLMHNSLASSRSDVKILEATESIRYLGQKISKEYLYYYHNPQKNNLKEEILMDIEMLEWSIKDISMSTKNIDSKNMLDFLSYNKNEIKELLKQPVNKDRSILMLDYSESFLEGANSISSMHQYEFSNEEKMLISINELEYLLERVSKYYIASNLNIDRINNLEHMMQAIQKIEIIFKNINLYTYPDALEEERARINSIWKTHKEFLYKSEKIFLPNLLEASSNHLKKIIEKIAMYHKQNQ